MKVINHVETRLLRKEKQGITLSHIVLHLDDSFHALMALLNKYKKIKLSLISTGILAEAALPESSVQ